MGLLAVFWYFILCSIKFELSFQLKEKKNSYYKYTGPLFSVTLQNSSHILKTKNSSLNKAFLLNDTFSSFLFFFCCCFEQTSMREGHYLFNTEKSKSINLPINSEDPATVFYWEWGRNPNKCLHCYKYFTIFVNINDSI